MAELYNFFGDVFDYLRETYGNVTLGDYRNFSLPSGGISLSALVFALAVGIILAAAVTLYEKNYIGGFVRALLSRDAKTEESALTLADLGVKAGFGIRRALRAKDGALRRVVRIAGYEEENDGTRVSRNGKNSVKMTEELDFETARFYIPEALRAHADVRYEAKGSGARAFILTVVLVLVASLVILRFLPSLFRLTDDLLTAINSW